MIKCVACKGRGNFADDIMGTSFSDCSVCKGTGEAEAIMPKKIYCSSKLRHRALWQMLSSEASSQIVSTWHKPENGPVDKTDSSELQLRWAKYVGEINECDELHLFIDEADNPHKGSLFEAGVAYGLGKKIVVLTPEATPEYKVWELLGTWYHVDGVEVRWI